MSDVTRVLYVIFNSRNGNFIGVKTSELMKKTIIGETTYVPIATFSAGQALSADLVLQNQAKNLFQDYLYSLSDVDRDTLENQLRISLGLKSDMHIPKLNGFALMMLTLPEHKTGIQKFQANSQARYEIQLI